MKYVEFKDLVVAAAKENQIAEYELYYTESESFSTETMMHQIDGFSTSSDAGACFRCICDGKMGYASTELFTAEEASRIVLAAMENAKNIETEDEVFIHEAGDTYVELEPQKTKEPTAEEMIELVTDMEAKVYAKDSRVIDGSQAFAAFGRETTALCNSKGLDLSYSYDYSMAGAVAILAEDGAMYNAYKFECGDFANFDGDQIAADAVTDAVESIGKESIDSGVYNLAIANKTMSSLLATYFSVFSAESAQKGISLFNDKEGEMVAAEIVNIVDDPFCKEAYNLMPFDGEGVATYKKSVIENGKLITLLHSLTTASKKGVPSTGNGRKGNYAATVSVRPYNFYIEKGGAGTKEDIFAKMGNGIYITSFQGLHSGANPVTGDFSLAAEGFLIQDGEKKHVIKNFTVSGNFYELLKKIILIGDDLKHSSPGGGCTFGSPTVLVEGLSVAGK